MEDDRSSKNILMMKPSMAVTVSDPQASKYSLFPTLADQRWHRPVPLKTSDHGNTAQDGRQILRRSVSGQQNVNDRQLSLIERSNGSVYFRILPATHTVLAQNDTYALGRGQ